MNPHDTSAAQAPSDRRAITPRQRPDRVRIVLRAGRLRVVEPHHDAAPPVPSVTPVLAERPARRHWWSR
ncbi:MAG TPA: hypothetical protein VFS08_14715 [Gemmatimonadaceae bacterium]|nr:hypothetical protein [Gemmatimonadaceae bacterium]